DRTPIQNGDGSFNFDDVIVDTRSGTLAQDYIPGFPAVESETSVGVEVRDDTPVTRSITNLDLSAIRVTLSLPNGLQKTDTSNGDITGHKIDYTIALSVDGGS